VPKPVALFAILLAGCGKTYAPAGVCEEYYRVTGECQGVEYTHWCGADNQNPGDACYEEWQAWMGCWVSVAEVACDLGEAHDACMGVLAEWDACAAGGR
jgi:hypothetical protein